MQLKDIYKLFLESEGVCTDSRQIKKNTIFFSLKGKNFNGNLFADQALSLGCSFCVIDDKKYKKSEKYIFVDDVLICLQELASLHRSKLECKLIAITGSNGKTTSKELISSVLRKKYNVLSTEGNLNNHIGVPLTLLKLNKSHHFAVIEMGANLLKEIELLCEIAKPNFGLITNITLIVNLFILLGVLTLFEATLTLPGIAGIILTVGMAVDANVLIFERKCSLKNKNKYL